jgi:YD repeat-containing protein
MAPGVRRSKSQIVGFSFADTNRSSPYANGVATTFSYSPTRRWLLRVLTKNAGGVSLIDNAYTRDAAGRILTITGLTPAESWTYTYDDLDRLISADNLGDNSLDETFTYAGLSAPPLSGKPLAGTRDNMPSRTRNPGGQSAAPGTPPYAYVYPAGTAARPHTPPKISSPASLPPAISPATGLLPG